MQELAKECSDPRDGNALKWCASKGIQGKLLWKHFVEEQCLNIVDILQLFPSCKPSITVLLTHLPPMAPRYYSIASSPLTMCSMVCVAFSMVEFDCNPSIIKNTDTTSNNTNTSISGVRRKGLCTSYLEDILQRFLNKSKSQSNTKTNANTNSNSNKHPGGTVRIFHKPNINFHLPSSVSCPLILVGPGTGVSPFVGFLDHRAQQERERTNFVDDAVCGVWRGEFEFDSEDLPAECNSVEKYVQEQEPGPISLYFGCRNESDYLYKDLLAKHVRDGTVTTLQVALSRVQAYKVYVTHKIQEDGDKLAELILNQQAYIYICGDGNQMAKDVESVLKESLINYTKKHMPSDYNPSISPFISTSTSPVPGSSLLSVALSQNVSTESLVSTATTASGTSIGSNGNINGSYGASGTASGSMYSQSVQYQSMKWVRNNEEADVFFQDLKTRKRYCQDIWS